MAGPFYYGLETRTSTCISLKLNIKILERFITSMSFANVLNFIGFGLFSWIGHGKYEFF